MDELTRRALARLPMSEEEVRAAYHCRDVDRLPEYEYLPGGDTRCSVTPEVVGKLLRIRGQLCVSVATLCESHERLRLECEGLRSLEAASRRAAVRLSAELQASLDRVAEGRAMLSRVAAALERFEGEPSRRALTLALVVAIRKTLEKGETDGTT